MDIDLIRELLELARLHQLAELEVEQGGLRLKIRKEGSGFVAAAGPASPATPAPIVAASPAGSTTAAAAVPALAVEPVAPEPGVELAVVKSPIVGTFYRAPEPGAPPFVEIGTRVKKGQILCIVEAMKLMNEIDSDYDGDIVNIYVENAQAVQFGERLFAIRTK
jgi:acetyl-CoA carboxylase biotin carboxyl carrier protein